MGSLNVGTASQVSNSAGHLQNAVMAASAKVEDIKILFHYCLSLGIQLAVFHYLLPPHLRVTMYPPWLQACLLQLASAYHALANHGRALSSLLILQFGKIHSGKVNLHIYSVHKGTGNFTPIVFNISLLAGANMAGITKVTAGTGVLRSH